MTAGRAPARVRYIPALDGIRGLLLPGVILIHFEIFFLFRPDLPGWLRQMGPFELNIEMFFVLSGALITSLLVTEHERAGSVSLKDFYLRRSRRLGPALVAVVPLMVIAQLAWNGDPGQGPLGPHPLLAIGAVSLFLGNWVLFRVASGIGWLGPAWTLGIEEQFYLTWPLVLRASLRRRLERAVVLLGFASALVITLGIASVIQAHYGVAATYYTTFTQLPCLIAGCALGYELTTNRGGRLARLVQPGWVGAAGLLGVGLVSYALTQHQAFVFRGGYIAYAVAACLLVGHCMVVETDASLVTRALGWRPLRAMGAVSYEAYLIHVIVILAVLAVAPQMAIYPMIALDLTITAGASFALYRLIGQPIRRRGWRPYFAPLARPLPALQVGVSGRPFALAGGALAGAAAIAVVGGVILAGGTGGGGITPVGNPANTVVNAAGAPVIATPGAVDSKANGANPSAATGVTLPGVSGGQLLNITSTPQSCASGDCSKPVTVAALPTITQLLPAVGPIVGGTQVTIIGTGFSKDARVYLGSLQLEGIHRVSNSELTFVMPSASSVVQDVLANLRSLHGLQVAIRVRTVAGESKLGLNDLFTYV